MKILTTLICLIFFSIANAEETPFCRDLLAQEKVKTKSYFWQSLRLVIFPGSLLKPSFNKITITPEKQFSKLDISNLKNVILIFDSLNPIFSEKEKRELEQFKERSNIVKKGIKKLKRSLKRLSWGHNSNNKLTNRFERPHFEKESVRRSRCYSLEKSLHLDYDKLYKKYSQLSFEIFKYKQKITADFYSKIFKKKLKHLKQKWNIIYGVNHNTFAKYISSNDIENIIIIGHSNQNHALLDTNKFALTPRHFLKNISPTIRSISIFSCESNKIENNYKLTDRLKNTPSIWKKRFAITVKNKNVFGKGNVVSPLGLSSFLKKVDKFLYIEKEDSKNQQGTKIYQQPKRCSFYLTDQFQIPTDSILATLNGNYLIANKVWNDEIKTISFKFNCNLIKNNNKNLLLLLIKSRSSDHSIQTYFEPAIVPSYSTKTKEYRNKNKHITKIKISF